MRRTFAILIILIVLAFNNNIAFAQLGDNGYEGGISSGRILTPLSNLKGGNDKQTYSYKEIVFVTGTPLILPGPLPFLKLKTMSKHIHTIIPLQTVAKTN